MKSKKSGFEYTIGNSKLGPNTLIFNMTSATDCPSRARGLCPHPGRCYAKKAERMYSGCLPFRRRQAAYWRRTAAADIARDLRAVLARRSGVKYVRFSEAGDFENQADVKQLYDVAHMVPGVMFYGYTTRRDLKFPPRPRNLILNGSGFMIDNQYTAVEKYSRGVVRCSERDCWLCIACKTRGKKKIENLYH